MNFEEKLRQKIANSEYGSTERTLLKTVLGELQQKDNVTDEIAFAVVKKIIKANEENLSYFKPNDDQYKEFDKENQILSSLLPKYLTFEEIYQILLTSDVDFKSLNEGQAIGKAMQYLKKRNENVEGQIVKQVVLSLKGN